MVDDVMNADEKTKIDMLNEMIAADVFSMLEDKPANFSWLYFVSIKFETKESVRPTMLSFFKWNDTLLDIIDSIKFMLISIDDLWVTFTINGIPVAWNGILKGSTRTVSIDGTIEMGE